ncbi:CERCAM [Symbiodinium sp. CCMP2456]|nr:CERCAM [Symbiodinium sp. CCMP2456]
MTEVPQHDVAQSWSTDRNSRYDGRAGYREGFTLRMSPGERGCAMSHVRAWRRTAAGNRPVLILEDDAVPAKQFWKRLKRVVLAAAEQSADALYLGHIQGAPWRQRLAPGLYEAEYLWTTVAYVLWPQGAQKLLSVLPVDQPVDNFMAWQMSQRPWFVKSLGP